MAKFLGKGSLGNVIFAFASAIVVEIIFNEKVISGIKKGVSCSNHFIKQVTRAGTDAYKENRDKFL